MTKLFLKVQEHSAETPLEVPVHNLVMAGWTGRDQAAVDAHIRELAELGVKPPKRTPIFYRVAASLATTENVVQVMGTDSTGEVEFVLIQAGERLLVGLGSDQTDRKAETVGVTLSKQLCAKPVAPQVWDFAAVEPHWDQLMLRSYAIAGGKRTLYQQGSVAAMRHPTDLRQQYGEFLPGTVMFCGTMPVIGGFRWADEFAIEMEDPVLQRRITHTYAIRALPVEG